MCFYCQSGFAGTLHNIPIPIRFCEMVIRDYEIERSSRNGFSLGQGTSVTRRDSKSDSQVHTKSIRSQRVKSAFSLISARGTQKEVEKVPILKKNSETEQDDATNPLPALHQCPEKTNPQSLANGQKMFLWVNSREILAMIC